MTVRHSQMTLINLFSPQSAWGGRRVRKSVFRWTVTILVSSFVYPDEIGIRASQPIDFFQSMFFSLRSLRLCGEIFPW